MKKFIRILSCAMVIFLISVLIISCGGDGKDSGKQSGDTALSASSSGQPSENSPTDSTDQNDKSKLEIQSQGKTDVVGWDD